MRIGKLNATLFTLCCLCFCAFSNQLFAQYRVEGKVISAKDNHAIPFVNLTLILLSDSSVYQLQSATDGRFQFYNILKPGDYLLRASVMGYADYLKLISVNVQINNIGQVVMLDSSYLLKEIIVKQDSKGIRFNKDTIEYKASFFKTNPDMDAIYLMNKMPGIDLSNNRAHGDSISKFMINGILIFNNNPKTLLAQLPAGIIDKIQVYNDSDQNILGMQSAIPYKVLNVKTKEGYFDKMKGQLFLGYALPKYYVAGANLAKVTKAQQASINASINRGNLKYNAYYDPEQQFTSTGNPLQTNLDLSFAKTGNKGNTFRLNYAFYNNNNNVQSLTITRFLDNAFIQNDTAKTKITQQRINAGYTKFYPSKNQFNVFANANFGKRNNLRSLDFKSLLNADEISRNISTLEQNNKDNQVGISLNFQKKNKAKSLLDIKANGGASWADRTNLTDGLTITTDTAHEKFKNQINTLNKKLGVALTYEIAADKNNKFSTALNSVLEDFTNGSEKFHYSILTQNFDQKDSLYSFNNHYQTTLSEFVLKHNYNSANKNFTSEMGLNTQLFTVLSNALAKRYFSTNPFLMMTYKWSNKKELRFQLAKKMNNPSYEQLNPLLIIESAYLYQLGQTTLRPTPRWDASLSYKSDLFKDGSFFRTGLSAIFIADQIADKIYTPYDSSFTLANYSIPKGTTLRVFDNIGDYWYGRYFLSVDLPFKKTGIVLKLNAKTDYSQGAASTNEVLYQTQVFNYGVDATLYSIISTKVDFTIFGSYNRNDIRMSALGIESNQRLVDEFKLNMLAVYQFHKRQSLKLETNYNHSKVLKAGQSNAFFLMNITYHFDVVKSKKISADITLHDVFNAYNNYTYDRFFNSEFDLGNNATYYRQTNNVGRYLLFLLRYNIL